jgi:hypothetical protein
VVAVGDEQLEAKLLDLVLEAHGEQRVDLAQVAEELRARSGDVDTPDRRRA